MSKHFPEPITVHDDDWCYGAFYIEQMSDMADNDNDAYIEEYGREDVDGWSGEQRTAKRLSDTYNACAGISDDDLADVVMGKKHLVIQRRKDIDQQLLNDALYCAYEYRNLLTGQYDDDPTNLQVRKELDFAAKTYESLFELYKERYG